MKNLFGISLIVGALFTTPTHSAAMLYNAGTTVANAVVSVTTVPFKATAFVVKAAYSNPKKTALVVIGLAIAGFTAYSFCSASGVSQKKESFTPSCPSLPELRTFSKVDAFKFFNLDKIYNEDDFSAEKCPNRIIAMCSDSGSFLGNAKNFFSRALSRVDCSNLKCSLINYGRGSEFQKGLNGKYRSLIKVMHPDKFQGANECVRALKQHSFQEVLSAYNILKKFTI